jgi:excisionase family DNA binding protein
MRSNTKREKNKPELQPLLSIDDVAAHFGVSKGTIYRMVRAGEFPRPERFGRRLVRWPAGVLNRYIDDGCTLPGGDDENAIQN